MISEYKNITGKSDKKQLNQRKKEMTDIMREKIMEIVFSADYKPCTAEELVISYCDEQDREAFLSALYALEEEGRVVTVRRGRIAATENSSFIRGTFRANARGFGFVTPDDGFASRIEGDLYISERDTLGAVHGDTVIAAVTRYADKGEAHGSEGQVTRVVGRALKELAGTVEPVPPMPRTMKTSTGMCVRPDKPIYPFLVLLEDGGSTLPHIGTSVIVRITEYPDGDGFARGVIAEVLGEAGSHDAVYASILHEYGIPMGEGGGFSEDLQRQAKAISDRGISAEDILSRLDLRGDLIFTLDGADAKDLDDAISVKRDGDGWILGVHIADVSHYVGRGSPLDSEALARATSVYLTDRVVPMLPRAISNGICSLTAGEDRLTLSAIMRLDSEGNTVDTKLCESVIHSKVRGVYSEFNDIVEHGKDSRFYEKYALLGDMIKDSAELYRILERRASERGALELETSEAVIVLGADGEPSDIVVRERGVGERMIEQFMLCANEAVANTLFWQDMPCVYRIHEDPSPEKMKNFSVFAHNLGLDISRLRAKKIYPGAISAVLREAAERDIGGVVSYVLLRSLMKARYESTASPHFGLAIEKYCHFTSPIRRYPDLTVHRFVKDMLSGKFDGDALSSAQSFAEKAAEASNDGEMRAVGAERAIGDLYKVKYMSAYVGEVFDGVVSSVTSFGMFVELPNTCEGLVPITKMEGYFEFDERTLTLSRPGWVYHLGDRVKVKLVHADIVRRRLDFELVTSAQGTNDGEGRAHSAGNKKKRGTPSKKAARKSLRKIASGRKGRPSRKLRRDK